MVAVFCIALLFLIALRTLGIMHLGVANLWQKLSFQIALQILENLPFLCVNL